MANVLLGHELKSYAPVVIEEDARKRGLYIIGKPGSGKTTLIEQLVVQDMRDGLGLCVLDPHGDLIERLLAQVPSQREDDVVLLDARDSRHPFGLNLYECPDSSDAEWVSRVESQILELFQKLWGEGGSQGSSWGPRVEEYIRNSARTLFENPGSTMVEVPRLFLDRALRERMVSRVADPDVRLFWQTFGGMSESRQVEWSASTRNKIDGFLQPIVKNIVGQSKTTANFRGFMDESKIVLVPLPIGRLGSTTVELLGSLIVLQILNAALSRDELPFSQRKQFNLYADEYHRFATPSFSDLLVDARKYAVSTTIAHQTRTQLDQKNRGASVVAGNLVVFSVQGEDADEMAKQFNRERPKNVKANSRPVRSTAPDPMQHLLKNGHRDEYVRELTSVLLEPIAAETARLADNEAHYWHREAEPERWRYFTDHGVYYTSKEKFHEGVRKINTYLRAMMEGSVKPRSNDQATLVMDVLLELRSFIGVGPGEYVADTVPRFFVRNRFADGTRAELQLDLRSAEALCKVVFGFMKGKSFKEMKDSELGNFADARIAYWESDLEVRQPFVPDKDACRQLALERSQAEGMRCFWTIRGFVDLGNLLADDPILVNSGQYEEESERRPFADVLGEIANTLVSQPSFEALCKVINESGTIETRIEIQAPPKT